MSHSTQSLANFDIGDGNVIIRVLSNVLNRLIDVNLKSHTGQHCVTKFQSSYAPGITVIAYLERIRKYSRCSDSCFIVALIYIDRIIEIRNVVLTGLNVHRILITSILLAAKFFDDEFYNNAFYAKLGGVPAWEMNSLEREFLHLVNFSLYVKEDCFLKYHRELRNYICIMDVPSSPISFHPTSFYSASNLSPNKKAFESPNGGYCKSSVGLRSMLPQNNTTDCSAYLQTPTQIDPVQLRNNLNLNSFSGSHVQQLFPCSSSQCTQPALSLSSSHACPSQLLSTQQNYVPVMNENRSMIPPYSYVNQHPHQQLLQQQQQLQQHTLWCSSKCPNEWHSETNCNNPYLQNLSRNIQSSRGSLNQSDYLFPDPNDPNPASIPNIAVPRQQFVSSATYGMESSTSIGLGQNAMSDDYFSYTMGSNMEAKICPHVAMSAPPLVYQQQQSGPYYPSFMFAPEKNASNMYSMGICSSNPSMDVYSCDHHQNSSPSNLSAVTTVSTNSTNSSQQQSLNFPHTPLGSVIGGGAGSVSSPMEYYSHLQQQRQVQQRSYVSSSTPSSVFEDFDQNMSYQLSSVQMKLQLEAEIRYSTPSSVHTGYPSKHSPLDNKYIASAPEHISGHPIASNGCLNGYGNIYYAPGPTLWAMEGTYAVPVHVGNA